MTTSKPAHVRLEVMVDAEHPERCAGNCPYARILLCLLSAGPEYRVSHDAENDGDAWLRTRRCLAATAASDRDAAIVEAAEAWRDADEDISTPPGGKLLDALADAVDAERAADEKEGK
jgi:hypothetical protein